MSLQVNKHLTNVSAGNTNGISPLTMPDGSESVVSCAAAGDGDGALNESVKELDFTSSPGTQSFKEPEDVFSPSQVGSPSKVEFYGGRRRVRILFGEQDPEKNPELFSVHAAAQGAQVLQPRVQVAHSGGGRKVRQVRLCRLPQLILGLPQWRSGAGVRSDRCTVKAL